jgi:acetyl esterase/lipase
LPGGESAEGKQEIALFLKMPESVIFRAETFRMKKILLVIAASLIIAACLVFLAFKFSPWPSALLIRIAFNKEAVKVNEALNRHVPTGIITIADQQYDVHDKEAKLDLYYPAAIKNTGRRLPVIVWIHGGGWISGNKGQVSNYCKILASHDYVVVAVEYALAPGKTYPVPVKQTNAALAYLLNNAAQLPVDTAHFILAGDSGGAHIVAQVGNIISSPGYADLLGIAPAIKREQLSGLLLYCGPYDAQQVNLSGSFGAFLKTVLWSYSGKKDFANEPHFKTASIINYITGSYPPCFISAGNGDPLLSQSQSFARKLQHLNVKVDTLFFGSRYSPLLPHEYQFNLDSEAGQLALKNSVLFLQNITADRQ